MAGFRALLGLSEAVAIPTGTKASTVWFPSEERSIATGWFNSGSSIGSMVTPPLVIWLSVAYGWRPAFLITDVLGVRRTRRCSAWVLKLVAERGLVKGERIGVDGSTMEANAALRRDHRQPERQERGKRGARIDPPGYDAGKKIKGKKRHILVDTQGLLTHAIVHAADVQDRDGGALLMATLFGAQGKVLNR